MELETENTGDVLVVHVKADRIDSAVAIQFKDAIRAATADSTKRVVLNLKQVLFVDSSGLGAIVAAMKFLGSGRKMDLAALNPDVDKVFRLTRMNTIFGIFSDVQTATANQSA